MPRAPRSMVISLALAALSAFIVTAPVQAQTVADCQSSIAQLAADTSTATFIGRSAEKDRTGLIGKLQTAAEKLDEGKPADALQALTQFEAKVVSLNQQGKIAGASASTLSEGVADAIACVQETAVAS